MDGVEDDEVLAGGRGREAREADDTAEAAVRLLFEGLGRYSSSSELAPWSTFVSSSSVSRRSPLEDDEAVSAEHGELRALRDLVARCTLGRRTPFLSSARPVSLGDSASRDLGSGEPLCVEQDVEWWIIEGSTVRSTGGWGEEG